jgi:hypothetical protein
MALFPVDKLTNARRRLVHPHHVCTASSVFVIETVFSRPIGSRSMAPLSPWRSGSNKPRCRQDHHEGGGGRRRGGGGWGESSIIAVVTEDNGEAWAETSNSTVDLAASFRID